MDTTAIYSNIQISATADNSSETARAYDIACETRHSAAGLVRIDNGRITERSTGRQTGSFYCYDGNLTISFTPGLTAEAQTAALLETRALTDACASTLPGIVVTEETDS